MQLSPLNIINEPIQRYPSDKSNEIMSVQVQYQLKAYYKISWWEASSVLKKSNFDMIVTHIGIQMYPVKDSAERGLVFSKYSFFGIPNKLNWSVMPGVYSNRKRDHRGRDGNLSQIFTTSAMENSIARWISRVEKCSTLSEIAGAMIALIGCSVIKVG